MRHRAHRSAAKRKEEKLKIVEGAREKTGQKSKTPKSRTYTPKGISGNFDINAATHDENLLMLSKLSPNILLFLQSGGKLDVNLMHTSDRRCSASQIGDARDWLMQQQNMELASRFLRFHIKVFIQS